MKITINVQNFNGTVAELAEALKAHNASGGTFIIDYLEVNVLNDNEVLVAKIRKQLAYLLPNQSSKIQAIKIYRECMDVPDLRAAKEWVEKYMPDLNLCYYPQNG